MISVARAVASHTRTVAAIQVPTPEMVSASPSALAMSSAMNVVTRPTPPRNALAFRATTMAMNGPRIVWAIAKITTTVTKPETSTVMSSRIASATSRPTVADTR